MNVVEARRGVRKRRAQTRTRDRDQFALRGGLNLVDPPASIDPGNCLAAENYEIGINGGYERLAGYERFDGHASPSATDYYILPIRHGTSLYPEFGPDSILYRYSSSALATIIEGVELTSPGYNMALRSEWPTTNKLKTTFKISAAVSPPAQKKFAVQPTGYRLTTSSSLVVTYNSKDTAPQTVIEVLEESDNSVHAIYPGGTHSSIYVPQIGDKVLMALFFKYLGRQYIHCSIGEGGGTPSPSTKFGGEAVSVVVDILNGTIESFDTGVEDAYIEDTDYGDGWKRVVILTKAISSTWSSGVSPIVSMREDLTTTSYAGDTSKGVYLAGLSVDAGTNPMLTPYRSRGNNNPSIATGAQNTFQLFSGVGYFALKSLTGNAFYSAVATQGTYHSEGGTAASDPFVCASGVPQKFSAPTLEKHLEYLNSAAATARAAISAVPGGGPIRGVWFYNGVVFAFRDDDATSPTVTKMYESTAAGWVEVIFALHLDFDAGSVEISEGDVITGATSGGSATVARVNLINTDWAGGNAAGTLVLTSWNMTDFDTDDENLTVSASPVAVADGVGYVPTWNDGGAFRFRNYNFYGASDLRRMYGVNGLDRGFSYDSVDGVLHSIRTGMATDTPTHVGVHLYHLFLGFPGGSVQNSGVGRPLNWTVITGASENAVGDNITEFIEEVDDTLFVFTRNQSYQLTGFTVDTFRLSRFDARNGAIENSVQRIGMGIHLDDRGFANLSTSDRFGNYQANTFSRVIQPLVKRLLEETTVTASVIHRGGNRYRCFFADGRFISIGVSGNRITGHMVCSYEKVVRCICSEEDTDGTERIFFGSDDGYIYEAERGRSFDGGPIRYGLRLPHHHSGVPDRNKKYHSGRIEAILNGQATVKVRPSISFGKYELPERDISASIGGAIWDHAMEWDGFIWDQPVEPLKAFRVGADGVNVGLSIYGESSLELPHTLRSVIFQTAMRGLNRETSVG